MEQLVGYIEIFAAVTGVLYVILEILQKNSMWVVGILTGAACAASFIFQRVWASAGLNIYYVAVSIIGIIQWRKDAGKAGENRIHLRKLGKKTAVWSAIIFVAGAFAMIQLLRTTQDAAPVLDGIAVTLSAIATWWLARSYAEQWMLWIVADILTVTLCLTTGQHLLAIMYLFYIAGAVTGWINWKKNGVYVV